MVDSEREKLRCRAMHFKTAESGAHLFNDATGLLVKPVMGHSLHELAKFEIPLAGSVRPSQVEERPKA